MKRRVAAVVGADVAGCSRRTGSAERLPHERLAASLDLFTGMIAAHGGRKVHEAGDAVLAELASASDAVHTAVDFQREMSGRNAGPPAQQCLAYRIGVHLGCRRFENIRQSVHVYGVRLHARDDLHPILGPAAVLGQPLFDDDLAGNPVIIGRCLCGEIRHPIPEPATGTGFCHCRLCQRALGGPVNAWTAFPVRALRLVRGEPRYYRSSLIAERGSCANCGSSLSARLLAPEPSKHVAVCTMSLHNPEVFSPTWHGGLESQMPWLNLHDELPRRRCKASSPVLIKAWRPVGRDDPAKWSELPSTVTPGAGGEGE